MKKSLLLLLMPALLLSACNKENLGKEVTNQADVIVLIDNINRSSIDIKNYEMNGKQVTTSFDKDSNKNVKSTITYNYLANENDELYLKTDNVQGDSKTSAELYLVNNEQYELVFYMDLFDGEKHEYTVLGYEGHEEEFAFLQFYFYMPLSHYQMFINPIGVSSALPVESRAGYDVTTKYYSKNDKNLTVKLDYTFTGDSSKFVEETAIQGSYTAKYDEGHFKNAKVALVSNKGSKSNTDCSLKVKDKFSIDLPKGWEDLINK